jgi:hypothetical protein
VPSTRSITVVDRSRLPLVLHLPSALPEYALDKSQSRLESVDALQVIALVLVAVVVGEISAAALAWVVNDAHGFTALRRRQAAPSRAACPRNPPAPSAERAVSRQPPS